MRASVYVRVFVIVAGVFERVFLYGSIHLTGQRQSQYGAEVSYD